MKKILLAAFALTFALIPMGVQAVEGPSLISTAIFPDITLKQASNNAIGSSVSDDSGVMLGGLGSDMYHVPGDAPNIFYVITDRGPNNDTVQADKSEGTGFIVPTFSPLILKVALNGTKVEVIESIAIKTKGGAGVTGLPNIKGYDKAPTDASGVTSDSLYNVSGLDTEGLVKVKSGQFWVVDEYGPSLAKLSSTGQVIARYVPKGWSGNPTTYNAVKSIPELFLKRKANRGFEALALSPDGRTLFVGLQSPLLNPTKAVGDASLATRILRFDVITKRFTGEFVFGFEKVGDVDAGAKKNSDLKLSAMVALDSDTLLVQERTDNSFLISTFEVNEAANILGSKWDLAVTTPSLESYTGAGTHAEVEALIKAASKKIVFKSTAIAAMPKKVEGIAVIDAEHIVLVNDDDFNFTYNPTTGKVEIGSVKTSFLTVKLSAPLPTYPEGSIASYGKRCSVEGLKSANLTCTGQGYELRWRK